MLICLALSRELSSFRFLVVRPWTSAALAPERVRIAGEGVCVGCFCLPTLLYVESLRTTSTFTPLWNMVVVLVLSWRQCSEVPTATESSEHSIKSGFHIIWCNIYHAFCHTYSDRNIYWKPKCFSHFASVPIWIDTYPGCQSVSSTRVSLSRVNLWAGNSCE